MPLGTFSVGHYAVTWNGNALGISETPHEWRSGTGGEEITSDDFGPYTPIDYIYTGQRHFVTVRLLEWTANIRATLYPFNAAFGDLSSTANPIGQLASSAAKALVFTATANTPAATNGPVTRTANLAILAPNQDVDYIFGVGRRIVPVTFMVLPYDATAGTYKFFVDT